MSDASSAAERPTLYPLHRQRITPDDYTENKLRYDQEISRVKQQIERLGEADKSFYVTASYLLQLFKHGEKIFEVASIEEKRELMKLVLSNLELKGKTARFTPNEPFATVLKLSERSTWQGHEEYLDVKLPRSKNEQANFSSLRRIIELRSTRLAEVIRRSKFDSTQPIGQVNAATFRLPHLLGRGTKNRTSI